MASKAAASSSGDNQPPPSIDDREDIQKKTFGKWINSQLASKGRKEFVTDLYYDLRDGHVLLSILEVLTCRTLRRERGDLRVHRLSNISAVLGVLRENKVKLVNINNVDIVDGSPKITLALVWAIILHWQFHDVMKSIGALNVSNLERALMAWCRQATADYPNVRDPLDFAGSWTDGLAGRTGRLQPSRRGGPAWPRRCAGS